MAGPPAVVADGRRQYRVLRVLGQGGYGTVYLAELSGPSGLEKQVAIKLTAATGLSRNAAAHLVDEARMLVKVRHSAIVQVDNLIRMDGAVAMVMEYVDGASLRAIWKRGPVPPRAALEIVDVLARALDTALTQTGKDGRPLNLIHRDIKPENVIVTEAGDVKLLDFGLARADIADRLARTTVAGQVAFTDGYRAPERISGKEFGAPADIYALGVVLFELLTAETLGDLHGNQRQHRAYIDTRMEPLEDQLGADSPVIALLKGLLAWAPDERPAARPLARQCASLFSRVPGDRLFEWASVAVPAAQKAMAMPTADGRVNRVYSEETLVTRGPDPSEEDTGLITPPDEPEPEPAPVPVPAPVPTPDPVPAPTPSWLARLAQILWTGDTLARTVAKRATVTLGSITSLVLAGQQLTDQIQGPSVEHPPVAAPEICNGADDDGDGLIDDQDPSLVASTRSVWFRDADGDGLGDDGETALACAAPAGRVGLGGDCDDHDAKITRDPDRGCAPPPTVEVEPKPVDPKQTNIEISPKPAGSERSRSRVDPATLPVPAGVVLVQGDPDRVVLEGSAGTYTFYGTGGKAVKAGTYAVAVTFSSTGQTPRSGGTVTVRADQTLTLTCRSDLETCG